MPVLYFFVIIFANCIGAISGMGGGVIIKPVFDFIHLHDAAAISFYATVAVFTMSIVSTTRQLAYKQKLNIKLISWVSIGSVLGGFLGTQLLQALFSFLPSKHYVTLIQIILTCAILLLTLLYTWFKPTPFKLTHTLWYILCGATLGFFASLLSIGGGPINVALLMFLFAVPIKTATIYSICTIFFSQLSKLVVLSVSQQLSHYDLSLLIYIIPAAIIGGLLGAKLSRILSEKSVEILFQAVIILVLTINIFNAFQLFSS